MSLLPYKTEQELKSLILRDLTISTFDVDPDELSSQSNKKVIIKCVVCQKPKVIAFYSLTAGRCIACSRECGVELKRDKSLKKNGTINPGQSRQARKKRDQTNQKKYGGKSSFSSEEVRKRGTKTILDKFGVDNASKAPEIRAKAKQTMLSKYGAEYTLQSPTLKRKVKATNLVRYGVPVPAQSPKVQQKMARTNIERYGVPHPQGLSSVQKKTKQTNLKKYGVEHVNQLPENRNRLIEWCIDNPDKLFTTKGELNILEWVCRFYPRASKYKDGTYEIDVYIPDVNIGIEYNGLYYHQESELTRRRQVDGKRYHLNKTKHFEKKDIRIIHIFEHEWRDRQSQVKSFLSSAIGKNANRVGARKCQFMWSSNKEDIRQAHQFLEDYHIQGAMTNTKHVIKCLYSRELMAVATFGKHHRNNKDWVLTRFCTKADWTIQGALSKMSKMAFEQLKEPLTSWADYRLSQGNGYEKAGWVMEELLSPDYFYHKNGKAYSKQSRQKRLVKTPKGMTEKEHAKLERLEPVYDCGKTRFKYLGTVTINQ